MKKIKHFYLMLLVALIASAAIMPGCDELVTEETTFFDTVFVDTNFVREEFCLEQCHNVYRSDITTAQYQWAMSDHADLASYNSTIGSQTAQNCGSECHTQEGFLESITDSTFSLHISPLGCFTCHEYHLNWDFDLRNDSSVSTIGGYIYNLAGSNICARCHQATFDVDEYVLDTVNISTFWLEELSHASNDADLILGKNGYQHAGFATNNSHTSVPCTKCHMNNSEGITLGGHSFNLRENGELNVASCNIANCHEDEPLTSQTADLYKSLVNLKMNSLKSQLTSLGLLDGNGDPVTDTLITNIGDLGALYNYLYISNDKSGGLHNYAFDTTLIQTTIDYLNNPE